MDESSIGIYLINPNRPCKVVFVVLLILVTFKPHMHVSPFHLKLTLLLRASISKDPFYDLVSSRKRKIIISSSNNKHQQD